MGNKNMSKIIVVLLSLIITTSAFAHEEPKTKLVFGKKCTVNNNTIVTSYVWKVQKNSNWQKDINKENCERKND
jgi:hypothetical protein